MNAKAQAELTHESATDLAEAVEHEDSQPVVISHRTRRFKFLEEIESSDYIMNPQVKITPRQWKRMNKIVRIHDSMEYELDDVFIKLGGALSGVGLVVGIGIFASWAYTLSTYGTSEINISALLTIVSLILLGAGAILTPFAFKRKYQKLIRKYGFIEFPELKNDELSKTNLTHEQIYEIALIGQKRAEEKRKLNQVRNEIERMQQQMKSDRVVRELERLKPQEDSIKDEINALTAEISEIINSGIKKDEE